MDFQKIYNQMNNPIADNEVIKQLINNYSEGKNMYSSLTRVYVKNKKNVNTYNKQAHDKLYAKLFKIWKSTVLSFPDNNLTDTGKKLKAHLKTIPDIKTYEEYMDLVKNSKLIDENGWHRIGEYSGWTHVSSKLLTYKQLNTINHRLYINTNSLHTELFASVFIDKCIQRNIPFYFKYDLPGSRDDTIVIYSDTKYLEQYISILKEIKQEYPNFETYKPPMLTGKIDGWIGYGSEPKLLPNGKRTSFNELRSKIIEKVLNDSTKNYIYNHQNDIIKYNGKSITFSEYLAIKVIEKVFEDYKSRYNKYPNKDMKNHFLTANGLVDEDITNHKLINLIKNEIFSNIKKAIKMFKEDSLYDLKIKIPSRNGKNVRISSEYFKDVFKECVKEIIRHNPNFIEDIKQSIIEESKKYGIDTNKYCFDIAERDALFSHQNKSFTNKPTVQNPKKVEHIQKQNSVDNTALFNKNREYVTNLYFNVLLNSIPEGFHTQRIFNNLTLIEYIEKYIVPRMNTQQQYIDNNGKSQDVLSTIKKIIDTNVFRTQKDLKVIEKNRQIIFETEKLLPEELKLTKIGNIKCLSFEAFLYNGEITLSQYLEECLPECIDKDGYITKYDGTKEYVSKYINQIVISELLKNKKRK